MFLLSPDPLCGEKGQQELALHLQMCLVFTPWVLCHAWWVPSPTHSYPKRLVAPPFAVLPFHLSPLHSPVEGIGSGFQVSQVITEQKIYPFLPLFC